MKGWEAVGRPGYLGKRRDERFREWNTLYGAGNWRLSWKVGETFTDYLGACALYEDAYFVFFQARPEILNELIRDGSNVYDTAASNVESGLDYRRQEGDRTHIQDISIRRSLIRMGLWFRGSKLIQIRFHQPGAGVHRLSPILTPGKVTFHRPDLMEPPLEYDSRRQPWYNLDSVEAFYQFNKYLLRKTS